MSCLSEAALAVVLAGGFLAPELPANVVYVIDGDTLIADIALCGGKWRELHVRLQWSGCARTQRSVPERDSVGACCKGEAHCSGRKPVDAGPVWKRQIWPLIGAGALTPQGEDIAGRLIREGLARPYSGGRRYPWC